MSLAWHIAMLMRTDPRKRLPKLETLLYRHKSSRKKQTPEEMLAVVKMLNAAFGGRVIKKKD